MNPLDPGGLPDPGPILRKIIAAKREEIQALRAGMSLEEMRRRAQDAPPPRDFRSAVAAPPGKIRLIAEVKKASPSKGLIRPDFDPVAIARSYAEGGAAAISVLTDARFFEGSLEIFRAVRDAVDLPVLRKEFMIDPCQFYEARAAGADAVLLIASILTPSQLSEFHDLARDLGMTALVETHSEADVRRAMTEIRPSLLGINNRDLHDPSFKTDLEHTARMLPLVRELAKPDAPPPIVSESGIHTPRDVARLRDLGVSAVLVGESLMRRPDPGKAARALLSGARGTWKETEG